MKKALLTLCFLFAARFLFAQWTTSGNNIYNSNTGYVGIGTSSPTRQLTVTSGTGVGPLLVQGPAGYILIDNQGTGSSYYQANTLHQFQGTSNTPIMTLLANGNVGIGTTAPYAPLSIYNPTEATAVPALRISSGTGGTSNSGGAIEFFKGTESYAMGRIYTQNQYSAPGNTNGKLVLSSHYGAVYPDELTLYNGNVGVGTSSPGYPLDVNGSVAAGGIYVNSNATKFYIRNSAGKTWAMSAGENQVNETNFGIYDWTDNQTTPYLTITTQGNVLIGKVSQANSAYILDIAGNVRANGVTVNTTGADFVFDPGYQLSPLSCLGAYVKANHHLPDIVPAAKMQKEGMDLGYLATKLLQKVEELTLYAVDADKRSSDQAATIKQQQTVLEKQEALLSQLQAQLRVQQEEIDRLMSR